MISIGTLRMGFYHRHFTNSFLNMRNYCNGEVLYEGSFFNAPVSPVTPIVFYCFINNLSTFCNLNHNYEHIKRMCPSLLNRCSIRGTKYYKSALHCWLCSYNSIPVRFYPSLNTKLKLALSGYNVKVFKW